MGRYMGRMVMEFFTFRMRRRMSNQRPRAAERPSADDDETAEDLVPGQNIGSAGENFIRRIRIPKYLSVLSNNGPVSDSRADEL